MRIRIQLHKIIRIRISNPAKKSLIPPTHKSCLDGICRKRSLLGFFLQYRHSLHFRAFLNHFITNFSCAHISLSVKFLKKFSFSSRSSYTSPEAFSPKSPNSLSPIQHFLNEWIERTNYKFVAKEPHIRDTVGLPSRKESY
jgi:hypothetical protein